MKTQTVSNAQKIAGGAAIAAAVLVTGYALRDAGAQSPVPPAAPVPQSAAVQSAVEMQTAFSQVARVAEPAVVTITTSKRAGMRNTSTGPQLTPDPDGDPNNSDNFNEFFRRFRMQPNSWKGDAATDSKNGFRLAQNSVLRQRQSGGTVTPRRPRLAPRPGGPFVETGEGSGMIYDRSGLILTNAHVVAGADRVTVKLLDGREFKDAHVLGVDTRVDVAVIKIPITDAPTVTLGDSASVHVGDWAIAVGNPFGLSNTMTVGVISAEAREVSLAADGSLTDYFQTDASINPGNSGGPLLDIRGRVVGINNAIYSRSGGNVGIGFAIPINIAKRVADSLVKEGRVRRALIGVKMSNIAAENSAAFGLPADTKGVIVQDVIPGSPAQLGGVQVGDVITAWSGEVVTKDSELQRKVTASPIGTPGTLTVRRNNQTVTLSVTPKEQPRQDGDSSTRRDPASTSVAPTSNKLGVALEPLTVANHKQYGVPDSVKTGVVVTAVASGSPAQSAGITPGDVITRVGRTLVGTPAEVDRAKESLLKNQTGDNKSVAVYIVKQNGEGGFIVIPVGE